MLVSIHLQEVLLITIFVVSFPLLGHFLTHSLVALWIFGLSLCLHLILHLYFVPETIARLCVTSNIFLLRKNDLSVEAIDQQHARIFSYYRQFYR